ncbi:TIR domain-containing protein [Paenibacillus sp. LMG 31460]|uniref:TIR domain-containing protein n=1 Tax=Paenibacillus germinis TaxID=2654979 RepID=A0ABX1ZCV6_9BACL|nr:TIR domain-containing protein [Paenibacillus germinis]NOU91157.1 TIR domain-containing protein [Paenibacillus germinis]
MKEFVPPLSIFFVWHPADETTVKPVFDFCFAALSRDINKPFSRSMNLPFFCRKSTSKDVPNEIEIVSNKTIVFIFISKNLVADDAWIEYVRSIPRAENVTLIPIAIDRSAFTLGELFENVNFIRSYEFDSTHSNEYHFIAIAHEIYRCSLNEDFEKKALGKDNALKLFLSHAKDGKNGIKLARVLKSFIDNSSMRNFFDATDIAPGYRFDEEIIGHINESTVIAIHTDAYSSRYWCQREVLSAKEKNRPMIAVDSLEEFEDRRFPFATNIPGVHVHLEGEPSIHDLLRILSTALLETIRFFYSKLLLDQYRLSGWVEENAMILPRPPEIADIDKLLTVNGETIVCKQKQIIYPEPPVYSEEISFLHKLGIDIATPLNLDFCQLRYRNIGISISDQGSEEVTSIGQTPAHLIQLSQDLARHIISRGAMLSYGGDLREGGFTEFIFNEALAYQARAQSREVQITNYIAWPIYLNDPADVVKWKADYRSIARMVEMPPATEVLDLIPSVESFLHPSNTQNLYVWSRTLTEMRKYMVQHCDVRISAGGRHIGYKGCMPGVLEEIIISLESNKPLFLIGGFGGVTGSVCKAIQTRIIPKELTLDWQLENNAGYKDLLDYYSLRSEKEVIYYDKIVGILSNVNLNNGLSDIENNKLFNTPFIDEALHLVFKGLKNIYS